MDAFWFSLLVNTAYFLADVFLKLGSLQMPAGRLVYIRSIFAATLALSWLGISGDWALLPSYGNLTWFLFCSLLCAAGLYFYIKAIQHMHFVNVAVIGIMGAFIHYLLGVWMNDEQVSVWFYLAAVLSVAGIVIQWRKTTHRKGLKDAILSAFTWGFGYALLSIPLKDSSAIWGTAIMEVTTLVVAAFFLILSDHTFSLLRPPLKNPSLAAAAAFTILGSVLLNISYQKFSLNTLGFMQLAFFPYSLLAGYFLFKEKLTTWEWIGNTLVIAGLVVYFFRVV